MTDEQRAELRKGLLALLRVAGAGGRVHVFDQYDAYRDTDRTLPVFAVNVGVRWPTLAPGGPPPEEVTSGKQLALSVFVGEPDRVITSALADHLIDTGHEYAAAVAEKARMDERERIAGMLIGEAANLLAARPGNDADSHTAGVLQAVADGLRVTVPM